MSMARFGIETRPAVLFDFDGTLADTGPAVMGTVSRVLRSHGIEPTADQLRAMIGPPLIEGFGIAFGITGEAAERYVSEYRELFDHEVGVEDFPPISGVPELLAALRREGRLLAVATSRLEDVAQNMIAQLGWDDVFEHVIGRIDGVRWTKAESIAAALEALGIRAEDAVMIGDRFYDSRGAAEVGVPCIGVYTGAASPGEHDSADAACASMREVAELLGVEI